jgi:predicted nucleic acid-binding protein
VSLVVDASITVRLLSNRGADDLLRKRYAAPRVLHAPHLLDAEVASALHGLLLGKKLEQERADEMLIDFSELRIVRHPITPHLPRVMALRHTLTAYDACYVALAEALNMPLLTLDAKLSGATGHRATVHIYPYGGG